MNKIKIMIRNWLNIENDCKVYDRMLDNINDNINDIDGLVNDIYNKSNYDNNQYGDYSNKNDIKDIILKHINLHNKGGDNNAK